MLRIFLVAVCISLAACATVAGGPGVTGTASVRLNADKALIAAQIGFKSLQQAALAGIQSGAIRGETKARVIDLVDRGQVIESQAVSAEAMGTSTAVSIGDLVDIVAQLKALGIKE